MQAEAWGLSAGCLTDRTYRTHRAAGLLPNTGWRDEARAASLAVRRAKAKAREEMFDRQEAAGGRDFIGNWYPRGRDGKYKDPHYGKTSEKAPYGYVDGTRRPRKEPLYDPYGRPIIPRAREDYRALKKSGGHWKWSRSQTGSLLPVVSYEGGVEDRRHIDWLDKVRAAEAEWGRFGKKKDWMEKNPDATEEDWKAHDKEERDKWVRKKKAEEAGAESKVGRSQAASQEREEVSNRVRRGGRAGVDSSASVGGHMNTLILNRDTFEMPADGWYQIAPLGEFPHRPTDVVQVVDQEACEGMVNRFRGEAEQANFAGLLIDFDHFSLDDKLKSEAAGWIADLEYRGPRAEGGNLKPEGGEAPSPAAINRGNTGLWAKIRWSDVGEEAVKGGRYRFLSPVWEILSNVVDGPLKSVSI